jgi:spore coat protein U-like protein
LAFGDLDPFLNTEKKATVDVDFWCTKGSTAAPTFSAADGIATGETRFMVHSSDPAETIPYTIDSFTPDANANQGPSGTPRKVTIAGTVPAGSYADRIPGDYSNIVTIEINP